MGMCVCCPFSCWYIVSLSPDLDYAVLEATHRDLREEKKRLEIQQETTRTTGESSLRARLQVESDLADKERTLASLRRENMSLSASLSRPVSRPNPLLDETQRSFLDTQRQVDTQAESMRRLDRLREESRVAERREYDRKLAELSSQLRVLNGDVQQDRAETDTLRSGLFASPTRSPPRSLSSSSAGLSRSPVFASTPLPLGKTL